MENINYVELNPCIRNLVRLLRDAGFRTSDSGDGTNFQNGMEGALDFCHVVAFVDPPELLSEADRLVKLLKESVKPGVAEYGPNGYSVEATYLPQASAAMLCVFRLCDDDLK